MQISVTVKFPKTRCEVSVRKNQEPENERRGITDSGVFGLGSNVNAETGEHECMKTERICECIIMKPNGDKQILENNKQKQDGDIQIVTPFTKHGTNHPHNSTRNECI